ncbi:MAG: nucleotidyltransferase domain-containing protein [Methanobacteriota archaeon]
MKQLQRFRRKIEARYEIKTMILFGSRARGSAHRFSDVDLILVSPRFRRKNIAARAAQLYLEWDVDLPVDFLCYTPEEFEGLSRRPSLVREALREGIPIPA